jgi:amino acid adenylation domain-containing protein
MNDFPDLLSGFLRAVRSHPERPALMVDGREISYRELAGRAASLAATLDACALPTDPRLTAILASRSLTAFAGVLGALHRGTGYVPLNPAFPADRSRAMLVRSGARALIVDTASIPLLDAVLADAPHPITVVLPDVDDTAALAARLAPHRVLGLRDLAPASAARRVHAAPNDVAYLLFTSGSTGTPKGVAIAHRNVRHFVDTMIDRYAVAPEDRFSQTFDLTFDLSVFDMFVAWERGACVCCPTKHQTMLPGRFILDAGITIWFSVPSTGVLMNRLRQLQPGTFPTVRLSLFCGEALPVELVEAWALAMPNSIIENLYGPTELTVACALYRWNGAPSRAESELGLVPIGSAYPGMTPLIADEHLREVPPGETGELLMAGPQVTLGYWNDPERTSAAFVVPPGRTDVYYRTGDRVRSPIGSAPMTFLGRVDNQVKVHGYRVELGEIEAALRAAAGVDIAIALGWPTSAAGADGIVAFMLPTSVPTPDILAQLAARLPKYMVPKSVRQIADFPLNANGKVDRRALTSILEAETHPKVVVRPSEPAAMPAGVGAHSRSNSQ